MRRRVLIGIAALVAVGAAVTLCGMRVARPRGPEPVFGGYRLGVWLTKLENCELTGLGNEKGARERQVMRQIGTNALPTLVHMLGEQDSAFMLKLVGLARKQKLVKISYRRATLKHLVAAEWLEALGPKAAPAVPQLATLFARDPSPYGQGRIAEILGAIGPAAAPAVPVLISGAGSTNPYLRTTCLTSLGMIHADPARVVPLLIGALHDTDANVRVVAADSLAEFGPEARAAGPDLLRLLTDQETREDAAEALVKVAPPSPQN